MEVDMTTVDVVIPVYNEEHVLDQSIATLHQFLKANLDKEWKIIIADNASTDKTLEVAQGLAEKYPEVEVFHIDQKGRGRALRRVWLESKADIVSYMDVDLSTGLDAFPKIVQAIEDGYGVAMGSRLMRESNVKRSFKRELTSRSYNLIIKSMFFNRWVDAQCGFKAVSRKAVDELVPLIQNQEWFFDTELLILAGRKGYKIKEVPVTWVEDPDTRVDIIKTVREDLGGLMRLRFRPIPKTKKLE
jgi:glycosyltransferase involved in cell wall biosynthesis